MIDSLLSMLHSSGACRDSYYCETAMRTLIDLTIWQQIFVGLGLVSAYAWFLGVWRCRILHRLTVPGFHQPQCDRRNRKGKCTCVRHGNHEDARFLQTVFMPVVLLYVLGYLLLIPAIKAFRSGAGLHKHELDTR